MVHFGTTYEEARSKTIDAINAKAAEEFPQLTVREAWTSRIIIRKLKERGLERLTPLLYAVDDCRKVAAILASRHAAGKE